jgi:tetratricopeptide (TPR) repeat protein
MQSQGSSRAGLIIVSLIILAVVSLGAGLVALTGQGESTSFVSRDYMAQGRTLLAAGKTAEARNIFENALKSDPKSVDAIRGLAQCAIEDGDDDAAAGFLHQLTKLAPKDRDAWRKLALCASRLGRDTEAISSAQSALSLAPEGDRPMSDLMTRILTSDMDRLINPGIPGVDRSLGIDPVHGSKQRPDAFDSMADIPRPEPPDPTKGLPLPGRR